jgi:hypothetical protein
MKILQRFSPALSKYFDAPPPSARGKSPARGASPREPARIDNVKYSAFCLLLQHIYSRFTQQLQAADAECLLELAQQFDLTTFVQRCQDAVVIDATNVRKFLDLAQKVGLPLYMPIRNASRFS